MREISGSEGSVIESKVGAERRLDAPHPGPIVKREYIDPLGIDVRSLAAHVGLDAVRLAGILAGAVSLDVDASIRLARALGLPAERLMQMQVRYDFSAARTVVSLNDIGVIGPTLTPAFPSVNFFSGRLGRASDPFGDGSLYFQDDAARKTTSDSYSGFHALWRGDGLRIYDPAGSVIWTGPVLQNLDGRILLPYEQTSVWQSWFELGFRADLAIGEEHAAFFARMREA